MHNTTTAITPQVFSQKELWFFRPYVPLGLAALKLTKCALHLLRSANPGFEVPLPEFVHSDQTSKQLRPHFEHAQRGIPCDQHKLRHVRGMRMKAN